MKFKTPLVAIGLMLSILTLNAQVQIGAWIVGENIENASGFSISMPDANTLAIGAPINDGFGLFDVGHVRVYSWSGTAWVQKGVDIDGEAADDRSGYSVSMPDANTLAIGALVNAGNGVEAGHVRVYSWSGTAWVQKGVDIDGEAVGDGSGFSVSMPDANTLAIGAPGNGGNGLYAGAGHVRVYSWSGTAWGQKGADIDGEAVEDESGGSVSMPDANTLAIGARGNDGNGPGAGHARVYSWSGTAWVQKGVDIDGEAAGDGSGGSVSMPDANTLAIGASYNDGFGLTDAGHVRVYDWSGTSWVQKGVDINGWSPYNRSGCSVSMPDANTLAIGAPPADSLRGHTIVYSLATIGDAENSLLATLKLYPNPASSVINVEVDTNHFDMPYSIYDNTGRIVLKGKLNSELTSIVIGDLSDGVYTISVGEDIRQTFKVNK
jgi:Secretion system C-terminal sorting domain